MTEMHVIPDARSTWRVYESDTTTPCSEHSSATKAELAARARGADRQADRVVVHDRYHRTRDAAPWPADVSAPEQHARARPLLIVPEGARRGNADPAIA